MESLLDTQHGAAVLLAGIVVLLSLQLFAKIGELLFEIFKKKSEKDESKVNEVSLALQANTEAVRELRIQVGVLLVEISELRKIEQDTQKVFNAVKILAGKKWPDIRKAIEENELPK